MSEIWGNYAVCGLGVTPQGRLPGWSSDALKVEAIRLAIEDAGLTPQDIDGYIYQGASGTPQSRDVARRAGLAAKMVWSLETGGATAISAMTAAMGFIDLGLVNYVVVVFGQNPATGGRSAPRGTEAAPTLRSTFGAYGFFAPGSIHSLAARRHMELYGTTSTQLGWIAVNQRANANKRPTAMMYGRPMNIEDHQNSRWVCEPLHMFDYCLIGDGGAAFIVTSLERAKQCKKPPVIVQGTGIGNAVRLSYDKSNFDQVDVAPARDNAFRAAGIELKDIDVASIYDCFTITVLLTLEGYGFCKKGEGGAFVEGGQNISLSAPIPVNPHGGKLSHSDMQGFTPFVEGVRQARGEGGATQKENAELVLVSGHGGDAGSSMTYAHATAVLRRS